MIQIIGKGGFGREVAAYCNHFNIQYFAFENECIGIRNDIGTVIAIGDEEVRADVAEKFGLFGIKWSSLTLGEMYGSDNIVMQGAIICPGTIVTTGVIIGAHCLININCTIGHDVRVGDYVTVNPGVNISGNVTIGNNCNIGSNAVIRNGISICDDVIVGAGAVVVKDITEPGVYVGNPVIEMRKRPVYITDEMLLPVKEKMDGIYKVIEDTNDQIKKIQKKLGDLDWTFNIPLK